jgi:glucodextranase-like protein
MRFRIGAALLAMALAVSTASIAMAQADGGTPPAEDSALAAPTVDQPNVAPALFLTLINPVEQDVELPLETTQIQIQGATLPGAVLSIDGDLVDIDEQGNFAAVTTVDAGANEIEVVASDDQGNQVNTSIFVTRGE